jgi:hypothetical protein
MRKTTEKLWAGIKMPINCGHESRDVTTPFASSMDVVE